MGELGTKLGLDELTGGAATISRALLAEFIGTVLAYTFIEYFFMYYLYFDNLQRY